ncbi:hypothetical protein DM02DRAFT_585181 [Periconia macrospinosa]|uniref:Uncharacterized protein n=1 Tax=Periconia macrospinosa TaxID=97972 RepID=A0A2V1E356_9PLEO|nr:hypothetical protein DM02DRAFT_585181 [Periconia macrospinosa]
MSFYEYTVLPIRYNSQCITFPEWVSLFTLCLAPLIAHIASGAPQVSYLSNSRPKWYDHLCHYNPTSIIWRYAVIADRRIRATRWSRDDLTASNAIFWTAKGWDGREDMVFEAAPYKLRCPGLTHVQIMSVAMLKTIIVTMQGVSALYSLVALPTGATTLNFQWNMGVDMIFLPLSILGLLRLCAATWLTEDFMYASHDDKMGEVVPQRSPTIITINNSNTRFTNSHRALDPFPITPLQARARFKSPSSWSSRTFRGTYLLIIGGVWAISLMDFMPGVYLSFTFLTTTSFLAGLFYFIFLTVSIILYTFYFVRDQTTTTIIPCISKKWYKIYTLLIMGFALVLIVVASIETNKDPYGSYVNSPPVMQVKCGYLSEKWVFGSPYSAFFGLASRVESIQNWIGQNYLSLPVERVSNKSLEERYWIYNFTGYCVGGVENIREL